MYLIRVNFQTIFWIQWLNLCTYIAKMSEFTRKMWSQMCRNHAYFSSRYGANLSNFWRMLRTPTHPLIYANHWSRFQKFYCTEHFWWSIYFYFQAYNVELNVWLNLCLSKLPFTFDKKLDILQKNKSKVESNLKFCPF